MSKEEWSSWLPLREDLRELSPYGAPQLPSRAQLNTNENPYPPSPQLVKAIAHRVEEIATTLNRYPDRELNELRVGLATFLNASSHIHLTSENIWAANGSNEIIQSLFLAFGGESALGFTPSYSMHSLIAQVTCTPWISGVRNPDFTLDVKMAENQIRETKSKLVFITTPNNPTGTSIPIRDIAALARAAADVNGLLIVDEAYAEFSDVVSTITLLSEFVNLVVVRTMSKAFAFAGARVGYLAANREVVNALQLVRLPYHLSAVTQAIALVALDHSKELLTTVTTLIANRQLMAEQLETLGAKVIPSSANFLLFTVPDSKATWQSLLDQGVLVRDVGLSGYLRVTIGNEAENKRFIEALAAILSRSLGGNK